MENLEVLEDIPIFEVRHKVSFDIIEAVKLISSTQLRYTTYTKQKLVGKDNAVYYVFTLPKCDVVRALIVGYKGSKLNAKD